MAYRVLTCFKLCLKLSSPSWIVLDVALQHEQQRLLLWREHNTMKRWVYGMTAALALVGAWGVGRLGYNPTAVTQASALHQASPSASPAPSTAGTNNAAYLTTFLDRLAANVGVDRAKLDQAIRGSANQTLDQGVTDGKLTTQQADQLRQRIAQFPNNVQSWNGMGGNFDGGPRMGGMPWGRMGGAPWGGAAQGSFGALSTHLNAVVDAVATKLKVPAADLRSKLQNGQSLLDVAKAQGVSEADLRATITDAANTQLAAAVSAGELTQGQADMLRQRVASLPLDQTAWGGAPWMR